VSDQIDAYAKVYADVTCSECQGVTTFMPQQKQRGILDLEEMTKVRLEEDDNWQSTGDGWICGGCAAEGRPPNVRLYGTAVSSRQAIRLAAIVSRSNTPCPWGACYRVTEQTNGDILVQMHDENDDPVHLVARWQIRDTNDLLIRPGEDYDDLAWLASHDLGPDIRREVP